MSLSDLRRSLRVTRAEYSRMSAKMNEELVQLEKTPGYLSAYCDRGQVRYYRRNCLNNKSLNGSSNTNSLNGSSNTNSLNGSSKNNNLSDSSKSNIPEYLGQDKNEIVRALELKNYYNMLKNAADDGLKRLDKMQSILEKIPDADDVFENIEKEKKHLIEPYNGGVTQKQIDEWQNYFMTRKRPVVNNVYYTAGGTRVRSNSELIIAGRFESRGIPYKYEAAIFVGEWSDVWFPDFTVLNKRTGEELYWEHFGIMDNQEYCADTIYKIEEYAKKGMIPGKNFIFTMESSSHPLNTEYVDMLIENYLV